MLPGRAINRLVLGLWSILWFASGAGAEAVALGQEPTAQATPKLSLAEQLGFSGFGAGPGGGSHVIFDGSFSVEQGSRRGVLSLTATIDPGWHVYSIDQQRGGPMPSKITVADSPQYKVLGRFQPDRPPNIQHLDIYRVPVEEHDGQVVWSAPIELAEGVNPQTLTIELRYDGQVCRQECIPIFNEKIAAVFAGYTAPPESPGEYRPAASEAQLVLKGHLEPAAVAPGGKFKIIITATPNPNWHVYAYSPIDKEEVSKPTLIYLPTPPGWSQAEVTATPSPATKAAQAGVPATRYHEQPVTWTLEFTLPNQLATGEQVLSGYIGLQTCTGTNCLPPHAVQFRVPLTVAANAQPGQVPLEFISLRPADRDPGGAAAAISGVKSYSDVAALAKASYKGPPYTLSRIILFSLLGGFILNLMPCVLPVIGLKALSFVQQGGESRARIFSLNLWFTAGLIFVFLVLASVAVFAHLSWGEHFGLLWFQVAMVVLVFAFALSFLGVWEVPIPGFAQSSTSSKLQQKEGATGSFFKGVFTTLLATPCSGPFLGTVFFYLLKQPPWVTYLVFSCIGLGMASPYLLIGAFPVLVRWLPKPGAWMEIVKQLMGFFLLGTVVYLFTLVNPPAYRIPTLALVIGVWFACWLVGKVPIYESAGKQLAAWVAGCVAAAAVGVFAFTYLGPADELIHWQPYSPETLAKLQREGKTVMIDFTADWCPTCKFNLTFAVNTPRVKAIVEKNGVVPLLADWSDRGPVIKAKLQELGSDSIPVMAIYPGGRPGEVIVLRDLLIESQVVGNLEKAGPSRTKVEGATAETAMAKQSSGG